MTKIGYPYAVVDPRKVVDTAYAMGIPRNRDLPRVPSVGLGSGEVTPLDMATAYSALSNGGYRISPLGVQSIILPTGQKRPVKITRRRAFSDGVAYEVTKILRANVAGGIGCARSSPSTSTPKPAVSGCNASMAFSFAQRIGRRPW